MSQIPAGYKQTEVGVIPEDWEVQEIEEIAEVKSGKRLPLGKLLINKQTTHPYIRVTDMFYGGVDVSNIMFVPDDVFPAIKNYRIFKDEIFISVAGTIGIVGKIPEILDGANLTENANKLANIKCYRDYLLYYLMSSFIQGTIEAEKTLGAQPKLALTRIRKFKIIVPPKHEQEAIAEVLSDADALIEATRRLIEKKRLIKQGTMQHLLTPKDDWEVKKLGEIAEKITRGASPRPIESPIWFDENSKVGWVRISDVTKSTKYLTETTQKLSELGVKNSRYVEAGNVIMSICATIGRPILTTFEVCIHDGFVVFQNPKIDKHYLYYYLTFIEQDWSKNGQTGSQMNLNTPLINSTTICFPKSKLEQTRIAAILSDMDQEIEALESKLSKQTQIKEVMMQNLLTGKVRLV